MTVQRSHCERNGIRRFQQIVQCLSVVYSTSMSTVCIHAVKEDDSPGSTVSRLTVGLIMLRIKYLTVASEANTVL